MIREWVTRAFRKVFAAVGVKRKDFDYYRDIAICFPTVIAIILASEPLFYLADSSVVSSRDAGVALIWLLVAIGLSLLSPNWNEILAAAWGFLAFRGLIGLAISRGDVRVLRLTAAFAALGILCNRLKRPKRNS
jgi:hypothetical protein